jgi:hypothetical protein
MIFFTCLIISGCEKCDAPLNCSAMGYEFGSWFDGCEGYIEYGSCILPKKCYNGKCIHADSIKSAFITVEGEYSGFYKFPRDFFESSNLSPEDVVEVSDRIYFLLQELAYGNAPFEFAIGEYMDEVYEMTSPYGFVLGKYASPVNNGGHHSWDVIAHEMAHSFWACNYTFYILAVPGPFLQEATALLAAQYVFERIQLEEDHFNFPADGYASLYTVFSSERFYQKSRYEEYVNLGMPYSQDETGPNYAILTSQALNYVWFLIGDEYGWEYFPRFYKAFSSDLYHFFNFPEDQVTDIEETTDMIAALNVAFEQDFRQIFSDLNFPIDDDLYELYYEIINEYMSINHPVENQCL